MSADAFEKAEAGRKSGECLWAYECDVPLVHGVIASPRGDRDTALAAALDDAFDQFAPTIAAGTWTIREITP